MKRRSFLTTLAALPSILLTPTKWLSGKGDPPDELHLWATAYEGCTLHLRRSVDGQQITHVCEVIGGLVTPMPECRNWDVMEIFRP